MRRRLLQKALLVSFIALVSLHAFAADVVVVKSKDHFIYDHAVEGFGNEFGEEFTTLTLTDPDTTVAEVRKHEPRVILAVGLSAAKCLTNAIRDIPVVFCLATFPGKYGLKTENTTGVHSEPSPRDQLQAFKDTIPRLKRLALPYDPERWKAEDFIEQAQQAASEVGLELITVPVHQKNDYPKALPAIAEEADALWLIRDGTVLSRHNFNFSLYIQIAKQLPVVAYGTQFVRKGAVCACAADYHKHGEIAAGIVWKILRGASPSEIPIQHPEGTLTINLWSAAKAGVTVPEYILKRPGVVVVGWKVSEYKVKDLPKKPSSLDFEE
jgi:putative ABC transport system substrate-binding protein